MAADPVKMYLNDIFTVTVNMAGLPGIAVPAGLDQKGLPLGLQLIGRPFDEETLFRTGAGHRAGGRALPAGEVVVDAPPRPVGGRRMFFYLSKIFWFFVAAAQSRAVPSAGRWRLAIFGRRRLGRPASFLAVLILVLASWTSIGAMMLNPLEERFQRPASLPEKIDGIVVLGGGLEGAINLVRGGYELNSGGDRFVETAVLARRFPEAKILVSGGVGSRAARRRGRCRYRACASSRRSAFRASG